MLFFWPVLLTQIWGLIQQSNLDDKALAAAQAVINETSGYGYGYAGCPTPPPFPGAAGAAGKFCTNCGARLPENARFCSNCGSQLN